MSKAPNPPAAVDTSISATEPQRATFRYRVALQCPTPIPHPELELEAADDGDAWQKSAPPTASATANTSASLCGYSSVLP